MLNLYKADLIEAEKELCKRSLSAFVELAWTQLEPGQPFTHGWHIDALSEHLEAVNQGKITRLLINIPPGTMKSMLVNVFFPAWEWGPMGKPNLRFIGASHSESLATRDCMKMRRLIQSDWYQERWPTNMTGDQNAKTYFENDKTGWRQACPVQSMTGRRGDRVVWDDPHSVEDAHSEAKLETAVRVFRETLPTRLNNPDSSAIIIVMQRLNENDVSGEIIKGDFGYDQLILPMEFEPSRKCKTSIGFEDPRKEDGELLFPARFPAHVVKRDKAIMGSYASAGQFQQRPTPLGGGVIRSEWFKSYKILPQLSHRIITADTAQKTKERNDYSVFECWGKGKDGNIYLIDLLRGKWEAPELLRKAREFWAKHKADDSQTMGKLRRLMVEDKASGTGLIQQIKAEGFIPISGIERHKDKLTRVMDVTSYIEAGYVMLPDSAHFTSDFLAECERFTADDSHAHDDQIDPMCDAINELLQNNRGLNISDDVLAGIGGRR